MKIKKSAGEWAFDVVNVGVMLLVVVAMLFPFLNQIALSFSNNDAVVAGRVSLIPVNFTLKAYEAVIGDSRFTTAFGNSVFYTIVSVIMHVLCTALMAYPLSRKHLRGRGVMMNILIVSWLFGTGGLIPNFLLMKSLGLVDTYWALWLPGCVSIYNVIIMKSFFQQLPEELIESAEIDGASQTRIFLQIILPLSAASVAYIALLNAVSAWNGFYNAMIYINSASKRLLPVYLNNVMDAMFLPTTPELEDQIIDQASRVSNYSIRAATLMCATIPIVIVYPFVQKHFTKGAMIGAIKG